MELLGKIALGVALISLFTFIILFGRLPALRKTPIGLLNRFLVDDVPRYVSYLDTKVTGGRFIPVLHAIGNYLIYTKNPIVLIIFMTILTCSAVMFLYATWSVLTPTQKFFVFVLLPLPFLFTYLSATNRAIYITPANHAERLQDYPYDHALFQPGVVCPTCNLTKPARSKHCSLCRVCVARCDHHCPWLNNCLGRDSYRYFLGLLLSLHVLELYGAYLGYRQLAPYLVFSQALEGMSWRTGEYWDRAARVIMIATNRGGLSIAGVAILAATTAPLPLGMLLYHAYLIWAGTTTNENAKWSYLREDMDDGIVFKAKRSEVVAFKRRLMESRKDSGLVIPEEPDVDWPIETDQITTRTRDGLPPRGLEHLYEQVWSLRAVENLYDLGFWDNLMYALQGI